MESVLVAIIAVPIVGLIAFSVFAARRTRVAPNEAGELIMRYTLPLRIFAICAGVIVPTAIVVLLLVFPPKKTSEQYAASCGLLLFSTLGIGLLLETHCVSLVLSETEIRYRSPWRRECRYRWGEIVEVTTFSYMYPFVFRASDGRKFTVSAVMTGVSELIRLLSRHLHPSVYARSDRGMVWHGVRD